MKRFAPHLLILTVGLALMTSNAFAQACQHIHQLSKILNAQTITQTKCKLCACEKMETYILKHRIQASILAQCTCDETNERQCSKWHEHPNSGDGELERWPCVWDGFADTNSGPIQDPDSTDFQSAGIPNDCIFDATITRIVKYCKDNTDAPGFAWPRAGYHNGTWKIVCGSTRLARGRLNGVDGVDPSYSRAVDGYGSNRAAHDPLPGGQPNTGVATPADDCVGFDCYLPGWQVGCITGSTTDQFFRNQCPPTGTYDKDEVDNISDCVGGDLFVINDFRGKQICITPTESWKIKACYSGGNAIDPDNLPCNQWTQDWSVRLEGVITIKATNCLQ